MIKELLDSMILVLARHFRQQPDEINMNYTVCKLSQGNRNQQMTQTHS